MSFRLKVTYANVHLHRVSPGQFVDSPEYEAVPPNSEDEDVYQVWIGTTYYSLPSKGA